MELIEQLKNLTAEERLAVIEAAMQLNRQDQVNRPNLSKGDDPFLSVIGSLSGESFSAEEIEKELYGEEST